MSVTKVPMRGVNTAVDTAAGDDANIGYTSAEGLILTGQGSTNDVTIKNDADADVIKIATGGTTTTFTGDITMTGTTPTLTIGDAGAEDAAIVFDGNAQDFHIGLDDTADSLAIGLGSALGTTDHMVFDATGAVTKPLQPGFQVSQSAATTFASASTTKIPWNTEAFDTNADFNTTTNRFTCPVDGVYLFTTQGIVYYIGTTAAGRISIYFYKNGSLLHDFHRYTAKSGVGIDDDRINQQFYGTLVEKASADDYYETFLYHTTGDDGGGSGLVMNYTLGYSSFSGALLG